MLTEEEKNRIRIEEIYRQEVRSELEKRQDPKSLWKKIWAFLNTPFGLWFLSTVAVGIIAWSYAKWEKGRTQENEELALIRNLDIEIASRLHHSFLFLTPHNSASDTLLAAIRLIEKPLPVVNIFPEFSNRNLESLLWELEWLVPDNDKNEVILAIKNTRNIHQTCLKASKEYGRNVWEMIDILNDLPHIVSTIPKNLRRIYSLDRYRWVRMTPDIDAPEPEPSRQ